MGDVLTNRALNRATLERQLLLQRSPMAPLAAVEYLVGLQAQNPFDAYLALWSRLDKFDPHAAGRLLEDRSLVRIVVMRATIHLVTADDALSLRPLMQPVLDAEFARHPDFSPRLAGVDLEPVLAFARLQLSRQPLTGQQLRTSLSGRFPDLDGAALAYACRCQMALVQVPPRGVWGKTRQVTTTPVEAWLGRPMSPTPSIDATVLRYLAAFGPATVADVAAWSRLTGFREILERLRPRLRTFRDQRGRELFDLPDAPRPDPDTPAPVRLLPDYDNALLSHADRSRFGTREDWLFAIASGPFRGTVLVDGEMQAVWHCEHARKTSQVTLVVEHRRLTRRAAPAVEAEARRVVRFWHPGTSNREVRLVQIG